MVLQAIVTNNTGTAITDLNIDYDVRVFSTTTNNNNYTANNYVGIEELPGYWLFYSLDGGATYTNVAALNANGHTWANAIGTVHESMADCRSAALERRRQLVPALVRRQRPRPLARSVDRPGQPLHEHGFHARTRLNCPVGHRRGGNALLGPAPTDRQVSGSLRIRIPIHTLPPHARAASLAARVVLSAIVKTLDSPYRTLFRLL